MFICKYLTVFKILLLFSTTVESFDIDHYQALTSDRKAYRIGDPLIVMVVESTRAKSSAATGVRKELDISAGVSDSVNTNSAGITLNTSGKGNGETVREGTATTQLSVQIVEIISDNLYKVRGKQNLIINGENQSIILSGLIRAEDISRSNTIMSNRIASADIEIHGVGDVSNAQRQSIYYKVMSWLRLI